MSETYGPYAPIRQVGNLYFISGQVGIDPETKTAYGIITEQTEQVLKNLKAVLATAELELKHVVKTTVFLTDMRYFAAVNEIYEKYFEAPRPARSAVAVLELPRVAGDTRLLVEIEAVAAKEAA
jgi:2-iminobutanoate/2-iminopropanoate deaminase